MQVEYTEFLAAKHVAAPEVGFDPVGSITYPAGMFEYQQDIVTWALRKGRCALFCDTGTDIH